MEVESGAHRCLGGLPNGTNELSRQCIGGDFPGSQGAPCGPEDRYRGVQVAHRLSRLRYSFAIIRLRRPFFRPLPHGTVKGAHIDARIGGELAALGDIGEP